MKNRIIYNQFLRFSVIIIALIVFIGCGNNKQTELPEVKMGEVKPELFKLKINSEPHIVNLPAEIVSDKQFDINAKVLSYVKEIRSDIGSVVKKGDIIMVLEAPEIDSQISALKSKISSQEAVTEFSKNNYQRLLQASKTEGIISEDALDKLKSKRDSDIALLESLKSNYEELSVMAGYLVIRAPFSGIITERNTDIGALVGPSGMNKPLMILQDNSNLRVRVSLAERYTPYIKTGDTLSFSVRSLSGMNFNTVISRKSGALDPSLRSELIEADIKNIDLKLLPGMIADVSLSLKSEESSYLIPKSALADTNRGIYVMSVIEGVTKKTIVRKKRDNGMMTEITGDLNGISVILKNITEDIKEGIPVNTVDI